MECEVLQINIDTLMAKIVSEGRFGCTSSFFFKDKLFHVSIFLDVEWIVSVTVYISHKFMPDNYWIRVSLSDPLVFEKLDGFIISMVNTPNVSHNSVGI